MNLSKRRNLTKTLKKALRKSKSPFFDCVVDIGLLDPKKDELIQIGPISVRDFLLLLVDKEL